jgi:hypothetical protein
MRFCGLDGQKDYPYLYINLGVEDLVLPGFKATDALKKDVFCTNKCPKKDETPKLNLPQSRKDVVPKSSKFDTADIGGICFPVDGEAFDILKEATINALKSSDAGNSILDIYNMRKSVGIACGLSIVIALLYIWLMSMFAEVIAWIAIVLTQLGLIGLTVGCYFYRDNLKQIEAKNIEAGLPGWEAPSASLIDGG